MEAKLVAFSDTNFELTDILFKEPLHAFCPRAFELLRVNLQGTFTTIIVRSGT